MNPLDYILKGAESLISGGKNALISLFTPKVENKPMEFKVGEGLSGNVLNKSLQNTQPSFNPVVNKNSINPITAPDYAPGGIIRNTILGIPKATKDVATDILQTTARTVGTVGTTAGNIPTQLMNLVVKDKAPLPFEGSIPTTGNKITETLFGGKPIKTIQQSSKDVREFLKPFVGETTSKYSSLPLVLGGIALDLTGWGGKKAVKSFVKGEVPEAFFKYLAKEQSDVAIKDTLKKVGLDEARSTILAPKLAKTKTVQEAKDVVLAFENVDNEAKNVVKQITSGVPDLEVSKQLTPEMKTNLVKAIDDYRSGGKNLELQADVARMAEDLNVPMPKTYGALINKMQGILDTSEQKIVLPQVKDTPPQKIIESKANIPAEIIKKDTRIMDTSIAQNKNVVQELVERANKLPKNRGSVNFFEPLKNKSEIDNYIKEQVNKREIAKNVGTTGITGKVKSFISNAKTKLVDFSAPIEDILNSTIKKNDIKLSPSENIHNQIDRVLRSPSLAGQFAKDNGIVDIIKNVDNIDALDQYLIAKHAIELDKEGIKTGRDIAKDTVLVKTLENKYEKDAKVISQYSQKLLDYSVDSGLISKDLAESLKKKYPDYVPFSRVFSEIEKKPTYAGTSGVASLSKQNVVQRIVGSEREIESPIESLLTKTNDAFKQGEKNKAGRLLASYEKLPNNPFQLKEITGEEIGNRHTISYFENGNKKVFETTKEIEEAAKALNVQQLNILGKIFALPVRVARVGITGVNVPFIAANIAKDNVSAFINSDEGLKTSILNPSNFIKSLFAAVKHNDLYQEMVRAGGAGTSFDISRNQVPQTIKAIRSGKTPLSKAKYLVTNPSELLKAVEDIIGRGEELTRLQQYKGTKDALIAKGMSEKEATIEAARMAREATVNFARRGEWGTVLNSAFLYLNASIQGTRTLLRNLKTKPLKTSIKIITAAMLPVATATAWNLSDEKRRKAYEDIPEYEKENNIIIIPNNPTKDEDGKWNVIKIPLSQEINNLVGAVRKPIESAYAVSEVGFKDFAQSIIGTVSPIAPTKGAILSTITPQAIKPTIESVTNTSLFTGYPIVSQSLSNLPPEKQIKSNTSKLAINLGEKIGVSPIKIDAFIKSTFGSVGSQIIGQQKILEAVFARFGKAAGGVQENKAYDMANETKQKIADINYENKKRIMPIYDMVQKLIKEGNEEKAQDIIDNLSDKDYEIYKDIKTAEKTKATLEGKRNMLPVYLEIQKLPDSEKQKAVDAMTDEEYRLYQLVKKEQEKISDFNK